MQLLQQIPNRKNIADFIALLTDFTYFCRKVEVSARSH